MAKSQGRAVGRPPKYTSAEQIEGLIDKYFTECEGKPLYDKDGNICVDKYGNPVIVGQKPPTVTGLALALGFTNRLDLLRYQGKKEFSDTITRAKSLVEKYAEERLFDRNGVHGAQFSLRYNFKGWSDKPEENADGERVVIVDDV